MGHTCSIWLKSFSVDGDEQVQFDIVLYLGVVKATNLTFPSPNMKQKDLLPCLSNKL
jgi:hypothetical protein